jgi:hypothetical protein
MPDLVVKYFASELDRAEEATLEALLDGSAAEAERFSAMALSEYRDMGLPEPLSGGMRPRGNAWRWPLACLVGGCIAWLAWPSSSCQRPDLALQGGAFAVDAHVPAPSAQAQAQAQVRNQNLPPIAMAEPRLQLDREAPKPEVRKGSLLGVLVSQKVEGLAQVSVQDGRGRELRSLFSGELKPGQWRFEWDGRLEDGSKASPGTYDIAVKRGKSLQLKQVQLSLNRH